MGRMYSAVFQGVDVTAAQDLFEINVPSDAICVLHSVYVGQETEEGDAQDEMLQWSIVTGHATSGSGGSAPTAQPLETGSPAFGGTVEVNNTTIASTGTASIKHSDAFNVRAGLQYRPTPEERIIGSPSARICIRLDDAPADSITMHGTAIFEEIGG